MLKNQTSFVDDSGYNQGFKETFAQEKRIERRAEWIIREMDCFNAKNVLEIGCGTGYLAYCIAQKTHLKVFAVDIYQPFIEQASSRYKLPNLSYVVVDFYKIENEFSDRFDYIVGNGILHHFYFNLDEALSILRQLLNFSGKIIFIEPNICNPYIRAIFQTRSLRKWARLDPGEMAFSKKFIRKKLQQSRFESIEINYKDFLLPGIPQILVTPSILVSDLIEKTPLRYISQSLLIRARKN